MPTPGQLRVIHTGARAVGLTPPQYRMLLRNAGGVESSTDLDNRGLEDVMAVLEDHGFNRHPAGPTYWRDKVSARGSGCGERMARKIHALAAGGRYDLAAMCRRMSNGAAEVPERLTPAQGWALIEALKAINDREDKHDQRAAVPGTGPIGGTEAEPARTPARGRDAHRYTDPVSVPVTDDEVPF